MNYFQFLINLCILLLTTGIFLNGCQSLKKSFESFSEGPFGDGFGSTVKEDEAIRKNFNDAAAYYNRGTVRSQWGDRIGAISDFTQVIRINLNDPALFYNIAAAYSKRADQYRIIGDKQKALSDYRKAAGIYRAWKDDVRYDITLSTIRFVQQKE